MEPPQYPPVQTPPSIDVLSSRRKKPIALIAAIVLGGLLLVCLVGLVWSFSQYRTYKSDADKLIAEAVDTAKAEQAAELESNFQTERDRLYNTYAIDPVLGNVTLQYPRDWSFYLEQSTTTGRTRIDAIFHPTVVAKADPGTYGLRLQLLQQLYSDVVEDYQRAIDRDELTATPVKSNGVDGLRLDGQIDTDHTGSLVILPIRDKTLVISTEANDYLSVFNEAISTLVFTP